MAISRSRTVVCLVALALAVGGLSCKKKVEISEKSKQLFGKTWSYDAEATRTAVLTKAGEATGIKNLKDIQVKGDVKTMVDYATAKTLLFGEDKKGGGAAYALSTGKGFLKSTNSGWVKWNSDETAFTLSPADKNRYKEITYKVVEMTPSKLVILDSASTTETPEIWTR
ncbi:MAG: hypothetical protein KBA61_15405 [Spirochaetes bacterium]|nr:hypothetical protein [Spirochaetota bacterium]